MKSIFFVFFLYFSVGLIISQEIQDDSIKEVIIVDSIHPVNNSVFTFLNLEGKKSLSIKISDQFTILSAKQPRHVFAQIPGVFEYDMDGTGNQINFSVRGLDPHRSWEFNVRKDQIITNTDLFAYPASHYSVPLEAIERIEYISGTAALQYGSQFGGLINYVSKRPDPEKFFSYENYFTFGNYKFLATFHRFSGSRGKFAYNTWLYLKSYDGYREYNHSTGNAQNITLFFYPWKDFMMRLEWTHSGYLIQLPGPLNDSMFRVNPRMATRQRNYYSPSIHIPSLNIFWKINQNIQLFFWTAYLTGSRNSVMFDKPANIPDTVSQNTLQYAPREVHIDKYGSYSSELKIKYSYSLFQKNHQFFAGVQSLINRTRRFQQGLGTAGTDYDLTVVNSTWGREVQYYTDHVAFFLENKLNVFKEFFWQFGLRYEKGTSIFKGKINYYDSEKLKNTIPHDFPLLGSQLSYKPLKWLLMYVGYSQAYRPVLMKDIVPASSQEMVDKNLKDVRGHVAEAGVKIVLPYFKGEITYFDILYKNRMGSIVQEDSMNNVYIFKTNVGDSRNKGIELFGQIDYHFTQKFKALAFTSISYLDARYISGILRKGNQNVNIAGNRVESAPEWTVRSGFLFSYKKLSLQLIYTYVDETFADPFNTVEPNVSGTVGLVPLYRLWDVSLSAELSKNVTFLMQINNLLDEKYFTKRPQFYPGPGIWPSEGRTLRFTLHVKT
ncbi:MAG: TonB-dependent receptor [Bacteroidales bacterium]|nr:TonB-dependent receptor [Bacteroidales bacterium]